MNITRTPWHDLYDGPEGHPDRKLTALAFRVRFERGDSPHEHLLVHGDLRPVDELDLDLCVSLTEAEYARHIPSGVRTLHDRAQWLALDIARAELRNLSPPAEAAR